MSKTKLFDVIIVGGSYAGLSAALTLVRARKTVLVIDSDNSSNRPSPAAHNFITHEGENPKEIRKTSKKELEKYADFNFTTAILCNVTKTTDQFYIETVERHNYYCKKILFATGVSDIMPGIAGFAECWAKTILHCPYCHGYEVKNKKMAIIANGEHAYHLCVLINNLTNSISLFTNGKCTLNEKQRENLSKNNIRICEKTITEIKHRNGEMREIVFIDGVKEKFSIAFAKALIKQQCEIPEKMGCKFTEHLIAVDDCMRTSVDGVYAAGDNCHLPRAISLAVAAGTNAAFHINWDLSSTSFAEK